MRNAHQRDLHPIVSESIVSELLLAKRTGTLLGFSLTFIHAEITERPPFTLRHIRANAKLSSYQSSVFVV